MGDLDIDALITRFTASQDLSLGALDAVSAFVGDYRLSHVQLHFSAAVTQTIKVIIDSGAGANYDTVLVEELIVNMEDFVYIPDSELFLKSQDQIRVQCTNTGTPSSVAYVLVQTVEK